MSQLANIEDGDIIKKVTGKIKALYKSETKQGEYGEYTLQNGTITIDGKDYKLSLMSNPLAVSAKGRTVTLSSVKGDKGYKGVNFKVEEFFSKKHNKDVRQEVIKVNSNATIDFEGGEPSSEPASQGSSKPAPKGESRVEYDRPGALTWSAKFLTEFVARLACIHEICMTAAKEAYPKLEPELQKDIATSLFIEANRKGASDAAMTEAANACAGGAKDKPEQDKPDLEEEPDFTPEDDDIPMDHGPKYGDWASQLVPSGPKEGKKLAEVGKVYIKKLYDHYKEKGFNTEFSKYVEQAGKDLGIAEATEEDETEEFPD